MDSWSQLDEQLRRELDRGPSLRLAILFGSAARRTVHPDSDIDIAIIPSDAALPLREELALQARLERACGRRVDLVRLDRASTLLRWQVATEGRALLEGSPTERCRFIAAAASEYGDFAPALQRAARLFRRRLAAGTDRAGSAPGGGDR